MPFPRPLGSRWFQDSRGGAKEKSKERSRAPKRPDGPCQPPNSRKKFQDGPGGSQDGPQTAPKDSRDGISNMRPKGSKTTQRRLELARKFFNHARRCDLEGFVGLRCTVVLPQMRGPEGGVALDAAWFGFGGVYYGARLVAPVFSVQLLLWPQGGSREAQGVPRPL